MADEIKTALQQFQARAEQYQFYRRYYDGDHRLAFATDKFRSAFGSLFRAFADNLCDSVVDSCADRLIVTGFVVEEGPGSAADDAWAIWQANRMARRAGEVHREALTSGDAYVIVWPDEAGQPTIYANDAADVTVRYDPESPGRVLWAAKVWTAEDGRLRLNMYWPERIEKYVTRNKTYVLPDGAGAFEPYEAEGEPWPLPNPYDQVPVFHFANAARVGRFGRSELTDVIPLQDALNKAIADMLVAMEYVALPQRWATGLEVEIDEATGKPRAPFVPGADRVWAVGAPDARFGQFDPANLVQFLDVQEKFRKEIATVSRTPLHFLIPPAGEWPSGEALRSAESGFLAKVTGRQVALGDAWEDVLRFALRVAGKPDARLSCQWKDPTPRADLEKAQVGLMKHQLGASKRQILGELGYSPQEIEQMAEDRQGEDAALGGQLLAAFDRDEAQ
jgi:hypothetical protein